VAGQEIREFGFAHLRELLALVPMNLGPDIDRLDPKLLCDGEDIAEVGIAE
jgi:hypothetical protein